MTHPRATAPRLAFPLSLVSRLGDGARESLVPLSAERARRDAIRVAGLDDFGDDDGSAARFERGCESMLRIDWNLPGRLAVATNLHWHLANRLRLVELLKRHPEVRQNPVAPPVVILGLFRTGSTFLHNVLASDPGFRAGTNWEFAHPTGRKHDLFGDVRWRRFRTWRTMTLARTIVPDQDEVHELSVDQYEEDFFLLENDFVNFKQVVGFGNFPYAWELMREDLTNAYAWHRTQLQILSHGRPHQPWVLKSPWHMWNLDTLLRVYPDAKIIHTHRDVASAIASQASLTSRIACRFQKNLGLEEVGRFGLDYAREGLLRGFAARDRLPPEQVFDVHLSEMRARPAEVLRALYEQFDLPHDDALIAKLAAVADAQPKLQTGVHSYSIEDFGLTREEVESELGFYLDRFEALRRTSADDHVGG